MSTTPHGPLPAASLSATEPAEPAVSHRARPARRRTRTVVSALAAVAVAFTAAACSGASAGTDGDTGGATDGASSGAAEPTVFRYQGTAGQVVYPELAEDLGYFENVTLDWVGDVTGGPQSIQAAVTGQTEFGGAFNGAIVKLAASGSKITSVLSYYGSDALTYGGFYTLEGSPITTARDLIGKTVGINTLGAQSEFVIREWLSREGLTADEIKQVELVVVPPINAEQVLRAGQADVVNIAGVTQDKALERGGLHRLFSEVDLFGEFSYGTYIFRDDYIAEHEAAVKDFVQGTARAIRWAQVTPVDEVRARFTSIIEKRDRNETTDLIPYWKSSSVPAPGGVILDEEIQTWIDWLVRDGELDKGQFEAKDLYTNDFNPYANGTYEPTSGPDGEKVEASS